jgi:hypothetical protein
VRGDFCLLANRFDFHLDHFQSHVEFQTRPARTVRRGQGAAMASTALIRFVRLARSALLVLPLALWRNLREQWASDPRPPGACDGDVATHYLLPPYY